MRPETWPLRLRLLVLATGDLAFNLYWQSVMLFLLFYYTEALGLPMGVAATTFMIAAIWDGLVNFAAGIVIDRRTSTRRCGALLTIGSVPLGVLFVLTYLPPLAGGIWGIALVTVAHLLFRTAYAMVNVPYLAMTARISADSGDRAFIAGVRMLLGSLAAVTVALTTAPIGRWLTGGTNTAYIYAGAAAFFAAAGTAILFAVGLTYREEAPAHAPKPQSVRAALLSLARNRAFVTLNLAMVAMIVAVTVLSKSILYYFKYFLGDESAGHVAVASINLVSTLAVPVWMLLARRLEGRALWLLAASAAIAGMAAFALFGFREAGAMRLFLMAMQVAIVGLNFAFWAMLPNTIEYGERSTGLRVEGVVFGLAALLQRGAIGIATAILGLGFGASGYVANVEQSAATLAGMHATMSLVPLGFLGLSFALMLLNPLRRGVHARIVARMAERDDEGP